MQMKLSAWRIICVCCPPACTGRHCPFRLPGHQEEGGEASLVDGEMRAEAPSKLVAPEAVSRAERDSD